MSFPSDNREMGKKSWNNTRAHVMPIGMFVESGPLKTSAELFYAFEFFLCS